MTSPADRQSVIRPIDEKNNIQLERLETDAPCNLCIRLGDLIFIAGLPPFDAEFSALLRQARSNGTPAPPFPDLTFERQVTIVMDNLRALMEAAGPNINRLLKVAVWIKDQTRQEEFDRIYGRYFSSPATLPTRTSLQVGGLPMNCDVEIEAIGYVSDE